MHYKSIFISDIHLGTSDCKAKQLLEFLDSNSSDVLYLVGDIIDAWKIQQNKWKWSNSQTNVIRKVLKISKKTRVVYVAGNHDEFLRNLIPYGISLGNIEICNQVEHCGIDGKRYLVLHGDLFDGISGIAPWLAWLGDRAYDFVLSVNSKFNWIRHKLGFHYWSLSKFLKGKVKTAVSFVFQFEKNIVEHCRRKKFDGVICGHIHTAEIKTIDDIVYMNDGDWVESCTALVEHWDGKWEIVQWTDLR